MQVNRRLPIRKLRVALRSGGICAREVVEQNYRLYIGGLLLFLNTICEEDNDKDFCEDLITAVIGLTVGMGDDLSAYSTGYKRFNKNKFIHK